MCSEKNRSTALPNRQPNDEKSQPVQVNNLGARVHTDIYIDVPQAEIPEKRVHVWPCLKGVGFHEGLCDSCRGRACQLLLQRPVFETAPLLYAWLFSPLIAHIACPVRTKAESLHTWWLVLEGSMHCGKTPPPPLAKCCPWAFPLTPEGPRLCRRTRSAYAGLKQKPSDCLPGRHILPYLLCTAWRSSIALAR